LAFADPQSITVNAVAQSLPRVANAANPKLAVFRKQDGSYRLEISHDVQSQKRSRNTSSGVQAITTNVIRSLIRFTKRAIVADPVSAANDYEELQISIIVQRPEVGFTATDLDQVWSGFKAWANTAATDKIFGLES
jgi:hypothetical protein